MREILFRGKAINRNKGYHRTKYRNGDWVYGLLTRLWDELFENLPAEMTNTDGVSGIEIDHNTVGQYTGLTDKNGKKIFEGDIVAIDHTRRTTFWDEIPETYKPRNSYSVQWDEKKDEINYKRNYAVEWKEKDARWILRNGSDQHDLRDVFIHFHNGIVIGNIHDNPELLKGGEG